MTSETTTTTRKSSNGTDAASRPVQAAVAEVRGAIDNVTKSVPDVARASRKSFDDMFKAIETGSDERVSAGVTLSLGLAIGMLLGGAPRLLILAALAPVAAMGLVLQDRRKRNSSQSRAAGSAS
ncbi:MAG TPA: hypothetical protein VM451_02495 [Candidatus Limnocylindria bacterium]|nr:hypothetical protein [Candidatus Limnocylindria bacterium]